MEDEEYAAMGKKPADRVKALLGQLDSVRRSQVRGSEVSGHSKALSRKFAGQVEKIFKNLPKPLEWRSFYRHDLPLLMDFCEEGQEVSIQHQLSQKCSIGRLLLYVIRYLTRYHLAFDNSIPARLACPPSFWRASTQEQIAEVVGLDGSAVLRIVQNTKIS